MTEEYINEIPKITKVLSSSNRLAPADAFQVIADFLSVERDNVESDFGRWEDLFTVAESLAEHDDDKMKLHELRAIYPIKKEVGRHVTFEDEEASEDGMEEPAAVVMRKERDSRDKALSKEDKAARKAEKKAKKEKKREKKEAKKRKRESMEKST